MARATADIPAFTCPQSKTLAPRCTGPAPKTAYHHGDLRNALVSAAYALARDGGPEAVILREAARRTGVSPTSAYRHFANHADLLREVQMLAVSDLQRHLDVWIAEVPEQAPRDLAIARFHAMCQGYVEFAVAQPGLYRLAFDRHTTDARQYPIDWSETGLAAIVEERLRELTRSGAVEIESIKRAEYLLWAALHGFAVLIVDQVVTGLSDCALEAKVALLADFILRGIA